MPRFYVDSDSIYNDNIHITGSDVNHIKNVLRMKIGDDLIINDKSGNDYYCVINELDQEEVIAGINEVRPCDSELDVRLYLFQALPKSDKMELIIQKAVELGVYEIIPVQASRCVVKLDSGGRQKKKTARWQAIAEAAAKQSGRGIIPVVKEPMSYKDALAYAKTLDINILPYENAEGMEHSRKVIKAVGEVETAGIFIGPEGGFEENEVEQAVKTGFNIISLGKRILRTETAGMTVLSIIMFNISD